MEQYYEVSVIVCSYNPSIDDMLFTLESLVSQKNIRLEIIVADDGSEDNLYEKVVQYFKDNNFQHWMMVCNQENHGTVFNLYSGIRKASGKWIKTISPGDALNGKEILREWIDYNEKENVKWSFSDAIYYVGKPNENKHIIAYAHPNDISPYIRKNDYLCRWNYLALDDNALGLTLLAEKSIMIEYIDKIVGKIIYAEDHIYRMMMFDGIVGSYFPRNAVLYQFGTGISTTGSVVWGRRLEKDWKIAEQLMIYDKELDDFQLSIVRVWKLRDSGKRLLRVLIKGKIKSYLRRLIKPRKTIV